MNTVLIMAFASVLLTVLYVGIAISRKREMPDSLSALVYDLPEGFWQWLWTLWLWAVVFLLMPALFEAMPDSVSFLTFFMALDFLFVGAMPLIDTENQRFHYGFAVAGGVLSQVSVAFICPWWLLCWLAYAALCWYYRRNDVPDSLDGKGVFLLEAVCWVTAVGSVFTHLISL